MADTQFFESNFKEKNSNEISVQKSWRINN